MAKRVGRKRSNYVRYPSGGVYHRREDASLVAKTANPRMEILQKMANESDSVRRVLGFADLGSALGQMHFKGEITETQRMAGDEFIRLHSDHRRIVLDGRSDQPASGSYEPRSRGNDTPEYSTSLIKRIEEAYDRVFCAVADSGKDGIAMMRALKKLCIENVYPDYYGDKVLQKRALDKVAVALGLTGVVRFPGMGKA